MFDRFLSKYGNFHPKSGKKLKSINLRNGTSHWTDVFIVSPNTLKTTIKLLNKLK